MEEITVKIILIGDSGVGKTSLANRYLYGEFEEKGNTIGLDFGAKKVLIDSQEVDVRIWDTAGQEKYHSLVANLFNGADGAIVVFDLSMRESFDNVRKWIDMINERARNPISMILIGNKSDLDNYEVTSEEAMNYASGIDITYFETSALTGSNVDDAFYQIITISYKNACNANDYLHKSCDI